MKNDLIGHTESDKKIRLLVLLGMRLHPQTFDSFKLWLQLRNPAVCPEVVLQVVIISNLLTDAKMRPTICVLTTESIVMWQNASVEKRGMKFPKTIVQIFFHNWIVIQ